MYVVVVVVVVLVVVVVVTWAIDRERLYDGLCHGVIFSSPQVQVVVMVMSLHYCPAFLGGVMFLLLV